MARRCRTDRCCWLRYFMVFQNDRAVSEKLVLASETVTVLVVMVAVVIWYTSCQFSGLSCESVVITIGPEGSAGLKEIWRLCGELSVLPQIIYAIQINNLAYVLSKMNSQPTIPPRIHIDLSIWLMNVRFSLSGPETIGKLEKGLTIIEKRLEDSYDSHLSDF